MRTLNFAADRPSAGELEKLARPPLMLLCNSRGLHCTKTEPKGEIATKLLAAWDRPAVAFSFADDHDVSATASSKTDDEMARLTVVEVKAIVDARLGNSYTLVDGTPKPTPVV